MNVIEQSRPRIAALTIVRAAVLTVGSVVLLALVPAFYALTRSAFTAAMPGAVQAAAFVVFAAAAWYALPYVHEAGHALVAAAFGARNFRIQSFRDRRTVGHRITMDGLPDGTFAEACVLGGGVILVAAVFEIAILCAKGMAAAPAYGIAVAACLRNAMEIGLAEGSDLSRLLLLGSCLRIRTLPKAQTILSIQNATVTRLDTDILRDVNLDIRTGEIVGILGANGSGKTTLLELCAGLLPESRTARTAADNARVAFALPRPPAMPEATFGETLNYFALLCETARDREAEAALDLQALYHQPARFASTGEGQRLSLAIAFARHADLLLLDEPETGLDVRGREQLRRTLLACAQRGAAVLLTTHFISDAFDLCTHLLVMEGGRVVRYGPVSSFDDLRAVTHRLVVWVDPEAAPVLESAGFTSGDAAEGRLQMWKAGTPQSLITSTVSVAKHVHTLELESNALA